MEQKLVPLSDRVLVKRESAEEATASGIILPDMSKETPLFGVVDSVGPDVKTVKAGQSVMMPKYGGTEVKLHGSVYTLIQEADIMGVLVDVIDEDDDLDEPLGEQQQCTDEVCESCQ